MRLFLFADLKAVMHRPVSDFTGLSVRWVCCWSVVSISSPGQPIMQGLATRLYHLGLVPSIQELLLFWLCCLEHSSAIAPQAMRGGQHCHTAIPWRFLALDS